MRVPIPNQGEGEADAHWNAPTSRARDTIRTEVEYAGGKDADVVEGLAAIKVSVSLLFVNELLQA